jgi:hypothetical protein
MKSSDLIGRALNWAVATCEGYKGPPEWVARQSNASIDWDQGGPIIERERIGLRDDGGDGWAADDYIRATMHGPTPLIAAMRCYVASKLGDEVDVPDGLALDALIYETTPYEDQ